MSPRSSQPNRPDRVIVELPGLKDLIDREIARSGSNVSQEVRSLLSEALRSRYLNRSLSEVLSYFDLQDLSESCEISLERLGQIACEADAPSYAELAKLSSELLLSAKELAQISKLKPEAKIPSFVEIISQWELHDLVKESYVPIERLEAIQQGNKPSDDDLIGLGRALEDWTTEQLFRLRNKLFNNSKRKQGNGTR